MKLIKERFRQFGESPYLIDPVDGSALTYEQVYRRSLALSQAWVQKGIARYDRVAIFMDNEPEFILCHYALLLIGAVAVPIQTSNRREEIQYILELTEAKFVCVTDSKRWEALGLRWESLQVCCTEYATEGNAEAEAEDVELDEDDPVAILFTSGTTGRPKGVVMRYGAVLKDFYEYGGALAFGPQTRIIQSMPISHADGWCYSLLLPFLFGSSVILTPSFDARVCGQFDRLLHELHGNVLIAVPSMLTALLTMKFRYELPVAGYLHYVLCGSAKLHEELLKRFEHEFETRILENYGSTEALLIAYYTMQTPYKRGSVGKISPQCEVRLDEEGTIIVRSPFLFKEYYKSAVLTAEVFDGTWFNTGDIGFVDEEGYLFLSDRKKKLINKAGYKINPNEIDERLLELDCVVDAVTIGHEVNGEEQIYSFVQLSNSGLNVDMEPMMRHLQARLERVKWPKQIIPIPHIARTAIGKVNTDALIGLINAKSEG
ncbi:acyl--CoA ligase [Paenibacillus athensensis]|nr:class I adenylate-forming enzyme family protein [Paenibacillus athensensis]MCD1259375.1 acyl--CoA ligase [Paenibacillus athensensis]